MKAIDAKKVSEYFEKHLQDLPRGRLSLEEKIGKKAAELFIERMASIIAQSNVQAILGQSITVPQGSNQGYQGPGGKRNA